MKATELLQKQHRDLEDLLERLRMMGGGDARVRQELAAHLVAHTVIEQEIFYPAVQGVLPEEVLEALEEHGLADVELARLLAERPGHDAVEAKTTVLSEVVTRHIRREESEILPAAERELGEEEEARLGERMERRHRQVLDTGYKKILKKALEEELPRTPARRAPAARKARTATDRERATQSRTARRAAAAGTKRAAVKRAGTKRAATKRAATKHAATKHAATKRAATKHVGAKRAGAKRAGAKRAQVMS